MLNLGEASDDQLRSRKENDDLKKEYLDGRKIAKEKIRELLEANASAPFAILRFIITFCICLIFITVDCKILAFVWKTNLTTLDSTPEKLTIIKYGFLFLASQLVIFSQGFGFSSIVKLIEKLSPKKDEIKSKIKETATEENK